MTARGTEHPTRIGAPACPLPSPSSTGHDEFVARHIGPTADELARMLDVIGVGVARRAARPDRAGVDPHRRRRSTCRRPASETEVLAALRALAGRNAPRTSLIGMGYSATITPASSSATCSRTRRGTRPTRRTSPRSARAGSRRCSTSRRWSPSSPGSRGQRLAARRGDGRRRGDDDGPPAVARRVSNRFVVHHDTHPQTIAVLRTRAEPIGIELVVGDVDDARRRLLRRPVQPADVDRRDRRLARGDRAGPRRRRPRRRRHRPAGLRARPPRPASSAPTSPSARRSASACRWGSAARTPRSSPPTSRRRGPCPAASSASAPTPPAARRCASPCRPASSTSAARRRRRTSARPRCCWPTSPASTPPGTARTGCARIAERVHRLASIAADALRARRPDAAPRHVVRHGHGRRRRRRRASIAAAAATRASTCAASTTTTRRPHVRRDDDARRRRPGCSPAFGADARPRPRRRRRPTGCRRRPGAPTSSSPSRCSTATTPSTRCCATCAGWPTATSPSIAR